jgi:hypothetical protein
MQEITQSPWFLFLTIIATFLTLITGTAAVFNYFTPHLKTFYPSKSKKEERFRNLNKVSGSEEKNTPAFKWFVFNKDEREQERIESKVVEFTMFGGIILGSTISVILGISYAWSYLEHILGIFVIGIIGGCFFYMIVGGIILGIYDKQRRYYHSEFRLAPLRQKVLDNPGSVSDRVSYAYELYFSSSNSWDGSSRARRRFLAEAFKQVNEAKKLAAPNDYHLLSLYASILMKYKKYGEAKRIFGQILQLDPSIDPLSIPTLQKIARNGIWECSK